MENKVALVMGAGSGTGRATALAFARKGASVVVVDIQGQLAIKTLALIKAAGGKGIAVTADMALAEDVE